MRTLEIILITGAATLALATAAQAQETVPPAQDAATAQADEDVIVVTAQRREQRLDDVPMSISVIGGGQIGEGGALTTQDLTQVTPGLVVARSSNYFQPTIRGIGSRNSGVGDEPNVATFFDGVYQAEQSATVFELANIERVEVLKGPQGTLFGRNATGGAINVVTRRPNAEVGGQASLSVGEFGFMRGSGYITGGLNGSGTLAASLAGIYTSDDGYIRNVFLGRMVGDRLSYAIRPRILFEPSDWIEIQLNGLYSFSSGNAPFSGLAYRGSSIGRRTPVAGIPVDIAIPAGPYETATQFVPVSEVEQWLVDARAIISLGFADLTVLASHAEATLINDSDLDLTPWANQRNVIDRDSRTRTQEVTLTSRHGGPFSWIAGVHLIQDRALQDQTVNVVTRRLGGLRGNAVAGFAEGTWEAVDGLFLTGGVRYTRDRKRSLFQTPGQPASQGEATFTDFSPRAVLRYEFSPDASAYASYSEGYKTGTYNTTTLQGTLTPALPERVRAYEVGVRLSPLRGLSLTGAAFHYDYSNLQVSIIEVVNGALSTLLSNSKGAEINGLEFGLRYARGGLDLSAGLSFLDPQFSDFPNASITETVLVNGLPAGGRTIVADVTGNDLIRAPRRSLNLSASYEFAVGDGSLRLSSNALFSARYFLEAGNRIAQPAYEIVNGEITYTLPGDHVSIGIFGRNLTNQLYFLSNTISTISDTVAYDKPRWFGATLSFRY